ncbi:MAG: energy-coupling factor transporter transmembrane component T [Methanoregula sp.]
MQDPRIRLACAFLLSIAAFISIAGAIAAFLWWLVFTSRWKSIRHFRAMLATLLLFVLVAAVMVFTGTNGLSYLTRMTAILLVGTWVYADSRPGDFLATGTWLCGTRMGFELGMIAEMAMGVAQGLSDDFSRIRIAMAQKEQPWGIRRILPAGRILIWDALRRADDTAELLAMRGYRGGGTICTRFSPQAPEIVAGACATAALVFACFLR